MVFCNLKYRKKLKHQWKSHNPYFNRWFSAIKTELDIVAIEKSHNPYFNRWFSAIQIPFFYIFVEISHNPYFNRWFSAIKKTEYGVYEPLERHNPYFNRWFSAIKSSKWKKDRIKSVTILILIDGFLQFG